VNIPKLMVSLPSALFEIHSLTSLTLSEPHHGTPQILLTCTGSNRLTRLPAAIGELQNLKELNIGNNKIVRYRLTKITAY
jgi:Leucine-rich repeat (LRR) protein